LKLYYYDSNENKDFLIDSLNKMNQKIILENPLIFILNNNLDIEMYNKKKMNNIIKKRLLNFFKDSPDIQLLILDVQEFYYIKD